MFEAIAVLLAPSKKRANATIFVTTLLPRKASTLAMRCDDNFSEKDSFPQFVIPTIPPLLIRYLTKSRCKKELCQDIFATNRYFVD